MLNQPTTTKVTTDIRTAVGITVGMITAFFVGMGIIAVMSLSIKGEQAQVEKYRCNTASIPSWLDLTVSDEQTKETIAALKEVTIKLKQALATKADVNTIQNLLLNGKSF